MSGSVLKRKQIVSNTENVEFREERNSAQSYERAVSAIMGTYVKTTVVDDTSPGSTKSGGCVVVSGTLDEVKCTTESVTEKFG